MPQPSLQTRYRAPTRNDRNEHKALRAKIAHDHQRNGPYFITCPIFTSDRHPAQIFCSRALGARDSFTIPIDRVRERRLRRLDLVGGRGTL